MAVAVTVLHRHWPDAPADGVRIGDVLMCDVDYPRHAGIRRYFWLLTYGVQLVYEPFGWAHDWYVDIVSFQRGRIDGIESITVHDRELDVVVEGHGPTYRLIDMDELADALERGKLTPAEAARALRDAQGFLEAFLHRGAPFPPPQLEQWFDAGHDYPALPDVRPRSRPC
ncbi:hypothetical protein VT50_0210010 [Streptomyces antioxidans]|uniref:DUF402 domain-containing protein n=1 Tax=Streptomyces antioxidans TaxID=1507734 RepID=A0A1V4D874_9ACTN|nr:DUF402 domain-containing protein [Streptomyces antioxidans]OPF81396.1 hypothetical protein VT50_0210010 [Streptomyces antioxidans]